MSTTVERVGQPLRPAQPDNGTIEQIVGSRIRTIRLQRQLTLAALAKRAGITKSFLSKIERGEKAPAISTIVNLAGALNTQVSRLIEQNEDEQPVSFVRRGDRSPVLRYASSFGYKYSALTHRLGRKHMEPFVVSFPPHPRRSGTGLRHAGEEFIYALRGRILFTVGDKEYILEPGDALYYDSSIPHWARSLTDGDSEALDITFLPVP